MSGLVDELQKAATMANAKAAALHKQSISEIVDLRHKTAELQEKVNLSFDRIVDYENQIAALTSRAEAAEWEATEAKRLEGIVRHEINDLREGFVIVYAEKKAAEAKLEDMTADYLRRHNDAVDWLEIIDVLEAQVAALSTSVRELISAMEQRSVDREEYQVVVRARAVLTSLPASPATEKLQAREPTAEMLEAARDWSHAKYGKPIGNDAAIGCWQAMYDARAASALKGEGMMGDIIEEGVLFHPVQAADMGRRPFLPATVTLRAYEVYSYIYGEQPKMVMDGCRGGFGIGEIVSFLYAHSFPKNEWRARHEEALRRPLKDHPHD